MSILSPSFLNDPNLRLLLFGGKGGVGKTSCATAAAIELANRSPQAHFLLVSTDPAHSVTDSLADSLPPTNLQVLELNAKDCLDKFKKKHNHHLREIALRGTFLDNDDINKFLALSLPGLDELMALLEIANWEQAQRYQCIVVDTAPTGHTLRLLAVPELLEKWLDVLDSLMAKHRYMSKLYRGYYHCNNTDNFLMDLTSSIKYMEELLCDPIRCRFVPVMLAETIVISETVTLIKELKLRKVPVSDIIINRLYLISQCPVCNKEQLRQIRELLYFTELSQYSTWGIPIYPTEVRSIERLSAFWRNIFSLTIPEYQIAEPLISNSDSQSKSINSQPLVEEPLDLFLLEKPLLLFAGKGGVGKTTLSCATALRLTQHFKDKKVLLFSTDPAHSLSACLDTQIGCVPTYLSARLAAMEIDVEAEFQTLKTEYIEELQHFLRSALPNADLKFDHEAMRRIIDLSPPGLDEVMALTRVMSFLGNGSFDIFILDSAPTGHLIRLLEMPELIDQWLKAFFGIFLKYKRIFRLPKLSQRLIEISKNIKQLRALLGDATRSALFAVSILTEMSFEETKDLIAACERMGINIPALFLNLITSTYDCTLCTAVHLRESGLRTKFEQTFSSKHHTLVYRQSDLRGLQRLQELGEALYRSNKQISVHCK
ncbi:MAG: ArsA family ATPase [Acidobacteriota bacterium]